MVRGMVTQGGRREREEGDEGGTGWWEGERGG